jgi:hypothetical protein
MEELALSVLCAIVVFGVVVWKEAVLLARTVYIQPRHILGPAGYRYLAVRQHWTGILGSQRYTGGLYTCVRTSPALKLDAVMSYLPQSGRRPLHLELVPLMAPALARLPERPQGRRPLLVSVGMTKYIFFPTTIDL